MIFFEKNTQFTLRDGIYISEEDTEISFPEDDYETCFQIEDKSFWFKHRNNCIFTVINKYSKDKTIFDIGGGNGFVTKFMQDKGYESYLIEPGISGILNAKKRGVKNLINSTLNENFQKNAIPNIGIFDVLEHIEDDMSFLKNINNKLQIGGFLFITVPAFNFLWTNEDSLSGHFRRYTINKLKKKLANTNFEIIYSTYFFSILPLFIFIFRTIPNLFLKKKKEINLKQVKKQHSTNKKITILEKIFKKEVLSICKSRKLFIGSSCLIVAKKK